ncbi:hypothetical protein RhiirA4_488447 [Rhizophagus irregularis]|uniref:Uncharacterized protein n=1 Tax=Rhizophagus irregularis TaxID=588596 RepID=A0A2I1HSV7_9GLOM|nr:hypothetical protein RhiirA4_487511 [Rhizophagus irregularis]PKY62264.1 hypothetical protein RhiirA4_488447 [Rhizophagus irregularis]
MFIHYCNKLLKYNNKNSIASRVKLKHGGSIGQRVKNRHIEMKQCKFITTGIKLVFGRRVSSPLSQ